MKIDNVAEYVQLVNENELTELKLKTEQFELHIKKESNKENGAEVKASDVVQKVENQKTTPVLNETIQREEVKSPIVGVIYLTPEPGKPPYVHVGDHVKKGQKLAIISAMKVMNDFVSPIDGVLKEICVENEEVVAFDQALFVIE